jgi:apolipoprotein N-acyltransferase
MARQLKDYRHIGTMLSEWIFGNLPFVFFLFFVGLVYIANSNYSQKQVRRVQTLQNELKDLKWRYNAAKADLMLNTKQSEVERDVNAYGLRASNQRTKRIIIEKK